jgi:putative phosphoribosyl transferase
VAYLTGVELLEELMTCEKKFIIVPGATHLFEEPGTLKQVAEHAGRWFQRYLQQVE